MKTDETIAAIVVESYHHDKHQVVTSYTPELKMHHFFYCPAHPNIDFGDILLINLVTQQFWVHHGNAHLAYRFFPHPFPGDLLLELISERMNQ